MRRLCSLRSVHAPPIRYAPTLIETGYETGYGNEAPPTLGRSVGPYATTRTRTSTRTRDTCSICSLRSLPAVLVKPPGPKRSRTCAPEPSSPLSMTTCAPRSRGLVLHALLCSTLSDRENERERERAIEREYERERASESTQD